MRRYYRLKTKTSLQAVAENFKLKTNMPIQVRIPAPLRKLTNEQELVPATGANIGEVLTNLNTIYPGLFERICDESGNVRRFVNIFVNDEDIRFLEEKATPLKEGDEISIVPAIAGG
jgi:molybdopterin synthase sulfur carrier subunit